MIILFHPWDKRIGCGFSKIILLLLAEIIQSPNAGGADLGINISVDDLHGARQLLGRSFDHRLRIAGVVADISMLPIIVYIVVYLKIEAPSGRLLSVTWSVLTGTVQSLSE